MHDLDVENSQLTLPVTPEKVEFSSLVFYMVYLLLSKQGFEEFGRCGYTILEWKQTILLQLVTPLNQLLIHMNEFQIK